MSFLSPDWLMPDATTQSALSRSTTNGRAERLDFAAFIGDQILHAADLSILNVIDCAANDLAGTDLIGLNPGRRRGSAGVVGCAGLSVRGRRCSRESHRDSCRQMDFRHANISPLLIDLLRTTLLYGSSPPRIGPAFQCWTGN